jgi:hypothetical protein
MMWILFLALGGVAVWQIALHTGAGAKRLECPSCDLYIMGARPSQGDSVLCPHCREFALYDGKTIIKPPPDHVAAAPIWCAELPIERLQWPATCCMCSEPATRGVLVRLQYQQDASLGRDMATRAATLGMFKATDQTTISLEIPHCSQHGDGAALVMPYEREQPNFGVAFRSYAYYQQFKQLNRSTPRKATMFGGQIEE